jgi:hypothetical protein
MDFLLSHWHCILPAALILVASLFMRDKPKNENEKPSQSTEVLPQASAIPGPESESSLSKP